MVCLALTQAQQADRQPAKLPYQLSSPFVHDNLTVYLIHGADQFKGKTFLTLDEALAQKKFVMKKWGENHVWLHKPILPFWLIALSFALLGVSTFALRLPSAILSTGAAFLTYLIGKEFFDRRSALIAATIQAANPFLLTLIQGYQFADHIDVALLFWVEVGVYFLASTTRPAWICHDPEIGLAITSSSRTSAWMSA